MNLIEFILVLATILGVTDGQTLRMKADTGQAATVKLACIDIPKTVLPKYHLDAKQKLQQILPMGTPVVMRTMRQDESDRILGEVYVDNRSVNLSLVADGNAIVDRETLYHCEETKTQYLIAEANAKNKRLGLWQQLNPAKTK